MHTVLKNHETICNVIQAIRRAARIARPDVLPELVVSTILCCNREFQYDQKSSGDRKLDPKRAQHVTI